MYGIALYSGVLRVSHYDGSYMHLACLLAVDKVFKDVYTILIIKRLAECFLPTFLLKYEEICAILGAREKTGLRVYVLREQEKRKESVENRQGKVTCENVNGNW